jgi:hypothetical protein
MDEVNEQQSCSLVLEFSDENGDPVIPAQSAYRIDDAVSGTAIKAVTNFTPVSPTHTIEVAYGDNRILNARRTREEHILTVIWPFGSGKQGTKEYHFEVVNLKKVTTP